MSSETLRESFFENLWPLILNTNRCQVYSRNKSAFFEPLQNFDYIGAHEYLAKKGYKDYPLPIEIRCFKTEPKKILLPRSSSSSNLLHDKKPQLVLESSSLSSTVTDPSSTLVVEPQQQRLCRTAVFGKDRQRALRNLSRVRISCIRALRAERNLIKQQQKIDAECLDEQQQVEEDWDSQLERSDSTQATTEPEATTTAAAAAYELVPVYNPCLFNASTPAAPLTPDVCGKLLTDFLSRQRPWYKEEPWQMNENLHIYLDSHYELNTFERNLLNAFFAHNCKCLVIDLPPNVGIGEMKRWQYLCGLFPVIVITRYDELQRQVALLGINFHALKSDDNVSLPWQQELRSSLHTAFRFAAHMKYVKYCADNIIFLYATNRYYCTCDTFRVVCKY